MKGVDSETQVALDSFPLGVICVVPICLVERLAKDDMRQMRVQFDESTSGIQQSIEPELQTVD
jgi:hypothetical protein